MKKFIEAVSMAGLCLYCANVEEMKMIQKYFS